MKKKRIIVIVLFILLGLLPILLMDKGVDYYFHVKMGEYLISNKKIPTEFIYSWYGLSNNLTLTVHEWLYETLIYKLHHWSNTFGSLWYLMLTILPISIILYKVKVKAILKKNLKYFVPFILLAAINLSFYSLPRPHILSWLFFLVTLYLSYDLYNNDSKRIYFLPLVALLWVNIQGGSANLVYITPLIFLITGLFKYQRNDLLNKPLSKVKRRRYLIAIIGSLLMLLINPYGYRMLLFPYQHLVNYNNLQYVDEWRHINIKTINGFIAFLFIFYNLWIFYKTKKNLKLIDLILFLLFVILSLWSYRFVPFLVLTSFFTVIDYMDDSKLNFEHNKWPVIGLVGLIILMLIIGMPHLYQSLTTPLLDNKLINYLKETKPQRLYNDYNVGGYLIYHEIPVFIDGRNNGYLSYNMNDYYNLTANTGLDPAIILKKYNFDALLVRKERFLDQYLYEQDDYELVMSDDNYNIYEKITN